MYHIFTPIYVLMRTSTLPPLFIYMCVCVCVHIWCGTDVVCFYARYMYVCARVCVCVL